MGSDAPSASQMAGIAGKTPRTAATLPRSQRFCKLNFFSIGIAANNGTRTRNKSAIAGNFA